MVATSWFVTTCQNAVSRSRENDRLTRPSVLVTCGACESSNSSIQRGAVSTDSWLITTIQELRNIADTSRGLSGFWSVNSLARLDSLSQFVRSNKSELNQQTLQDISVLMSCLRLRIFQTKAREGNPDFISLVRRWICIVCALMDGSCDRLILYGILDWKTESVPNVRTLVVESLGSAQLDCKMMNAILNLAACLHRMDECRDYSAVLASRIATSYRFPFLHCPATLRKAAKLLTLAGPCFSSIIMAQYMISFFQRSDEQDLLHQISSSPHKDLLVDFACNEMAFTYSSATSRLGRSTSATGSVPRLSLELMKTEVQSNRSHYPLANNPRSSHRELVVFIIQHLFKENKYTANLDLLDGYPALTGRPPILFFLMKYIDWLHSQCSANIDYADLFRRLRELGFLVLSDLISVRKVFDETVLIGAGQFGAVYQTRDGTAVKMVKVSNSPRDRCTLFSALNEALCQSLSLHEGSFCLPLISCGRTQDLEYFFIESPLFTADLKTFRREIAGDLCDARVVVQLLLIFSQILSGVQFLHNQAHIVHYDLKLDNILVQYGEYQPGRDAYLIPRIAIADYGEARILFQNDVCLKNRGTECIKSPEMLSIVAYSRSGTLETPMGTSAPSDIWSLGCLFFELLTGEFLFDEPDGDWISFYNKVTNPCEDLIDASARKALCHCDELIDFLRFLLVRDPRRRPEIQSVVRKFQQLYLQALNRLTEESFVEIPKIPGCLKYRKPLD